MEPGSSCTKNYVPKGGIPYETESSRSRIPSGGLILGIIGATVSITSIVFAALGLHQARLCKHCEKGENFR